MTMTPSARLSRWYRLPLVMLLVAVAGAAAPTRPALADATVASPTPAEPCQTNELDVSSDINSQPTVYAPGQVGTDQASLRNPTSAAFTDAYFDLQVVAPVGTTAPATAPTMSWSIDGGYWPGLSLSWTNAPVPQSSPFWDSHDVALPVLAPGSAHTLRFQAVFHGDSPTGFYYGVLTIRARSCFVGKLGMTTIGYTYYTSAGRTGCCGVGNHSSTPAGGAGAGKPTPVPPTAPVSATPSTSSASPAPTDSSSTVISATPSASGIPTPNKARGASTTRPPAIAWIGALLILAVAGLLSLRGRIVNPGRVPGPARLSYRYRSLRLRPPKTDIDDDSTTDPADRNR